MSFGKRTPPEPAKPSTNFAFDAAGTKTHLAQHVSQLNVMRRALPKVDDKTPPTRIGVRLAAELEND